MVTLLITYCETFLADIIVPSLRSITTFSSALVQYRVPMLGKQQLRDSDTSALIPLYLKLQYSAGEREVIRVLNRAIEKWLDKVGFEGLVCRDWLHSKVQ